LSFLRYTKLSPTKPIPIINSNKELGSGVAETANCAEKGVVIVSPPSTSANNCWKFMFVNGVVKVPIIGMVTPG